MQCPAAVVLFEGLYCTASQRLSAAFIQQSAM